jgi:hypothetical protein
MILNQPPAPEDFAPGYRSYLELVPGAAEPLGGILPLLEHQPGRLRSQLQGATEAEALFRYAPGKWSVKEVVAHLTDVERVMAYRMLRIGRGDTTPLPGFDENHWMENAGHDLRPLSHHVEEFATARADTVALLRGLLEGLGDSALQRAGTASERRVSVHALAWILAGHPEHHMKLLAVKYGMGGERP